MQHAHYVTIFSTGGKFRLVSTFTELHILTPAARSYTLVTDVVSEIQVLLEQCRGVVYFDHVPFSLQHP